MPNRLYSPHTVFLRQSGQPFEIVTALCSLLIGVGYDAFVVSGYAIKDVTHKIMLRVDSPYPPLVEEEIVEEAVEENQKYKITKQKDMESKFLQMMQQREIDKQKDEEEKIAEIERQRILEEEKRPEDDLEGQRIHAWVLLLAGERNVAESVFIEPSTGTAHPLTTDLYLGIESLWNHQNYWVNLQDCSKGLGELDFDLTNAKKWEHLLVGEPLKWRKMKPRELEEEETAVLRQLYDEKHLDMPMPWSQKINISHEVIKRRFPEGSKITQYKRTLVEEYAPYVLDDGLVVRVMRFIDFDCTDVSTIEEKYENRHDKLERAVQDIRTGLVTEYFGSGREDSAIRHIYDRNDDNIEAERTILFNYQARFDGLSKIETTWNQLTEYYIDRDDKLYFRQVTYGLKDDATMDTVEKTHRPILTIIQKFNRSPEKSAYEDIAVREFKLVDREINLKYHYGKDNVTASTRQFIKPSISEMGDGMVFKPELTSGYQAEIGAKPPRQLQLFLLLDQQIKDEEVVINNIRDVEKQISEFLLLRAHEMAFSKMDISLFNREQNIEYRKGMLDMEEKQRLCKEKEVEEEIDYLAPYLAKLGNPEALTVDQAREIRNDCLNDFRIMLVYRANDIQQQFEKMSETLQAKQAWYTIKHDTLNPDEEAIYFAEVKETIFVLKTLETRLQRTKNLSGPRYENVVDYLDNHPLLTGAVTKK